MEKGFDVKESTMNFTKGTGDIQRIIIACTVHEAHYVVLATGQLGSG